MSVRQSEMINISQFAEVHTHTHTHSTTYLKERGNKIGYRKENYMIYSQNYLTRESYS